MSRIEITLQDILWALKKYFLWICLTTLIFTVGAWVYTTQFVTPIYATRISMCVFAGERNGGTVTSGDLTSDARLANTYRLLLTSQPVMEAVSEKLGGTPSPDGLESMISASNVSDSQLISAVIYSTDPQLAVRIADVLADTAPAVVQELARAGEMVVVDRAVMPAGPVSPNVGSNVSIGFILGLLLSCAVIVLIAVLDTTVWREEDLENTFHVPVLGTVPSMTELTRKAKGR